MKTRYEYFKERALCYVVESVGIGLIAYGASSLNIIPVLGGFTLYAIGRDTSDNLVQRELRKERSELEKSVDSVNSSKGQQ